MDELEEPVHRIEGHHAPTKASHPFPVELRTWDYYNFMFDILEDFTFKPRKPNASCKTYTRPKQKTSTTMHAYNFLELTLYNHKSHMEGFSDIRGERMSTF